MRRSSLALAILVATACSDDRSTRDAGADDAAVAIDADVSGDAAIDAGPRTCAELLGDRRVSLDRGMVLTQIHPVAEWDGEAIWVVYARPDASGGFDIYATRIGCDGLAIVSPFSVSSDPSFGNDIDPELAIADGRMLIAWNSDDGTGVDNLSVRYRLFDLDGTPRGADQTLATTHEGVAITGNQLGVRLATRPDGGFVVAGARGGVPDVPGFSAYAQPLDADGAPDGPTLAPLVEPEASQRAVSVAVSADGTVWLAYDRETLDPETQQVMVSAFDGDAPIAAPALAVDGLDSSSGAAVLATDDAVWLALSGAIGTEIDLRLVDASSSSATPVPLGELARAELSPRMAEAADGALAMVWFRQVAGFTNEIYAARFAPGAPPTVAAPVRADTRTAPAYQPALTHVMGEHWFVAFAEGESPDFRLIGRFLVLPSP